MAAKKKFSAKQLAAQRKFAKIMKSGGFKNKRKSAKKSGPKRSKSSKGVRKTQPLTRKTSKRKTVAKTKTTKKKGLLDNIPIINNPTFKKAALGVGTATIGATILGLVAPGIASNPVVKPILAFAAGGAPGVIAQVLAQGGLGAITGNGNGGGVNPGFA